MDGRSALSVLTSAIFASKLTKSKAFVPVSRREYIDWVEYVLKRMQGVKRGMTRADLLRVFTTEGGLSTGLQGTFVSQDCPYFKVDVTFRAIGRPDRDTDGRVTLSEDQRDEIATISQPYLAFSIMD
jgi:hypothetical protein